MAVLEISCTIPLSLMNIFWNYIKNPYIYPYKGLADLHLNFGRVRQYPLEIWVAEFSGVVASFEIQQWLFIGCSIVYFLIFGLTDEARRHYVSALTTIGRWLHIVPRTSDAEV